MSIQINKVKIYKGTQLKVDYTQFSSTGEKDKDAKDTYPHNIHEDMVVAFAVLDEHLTHLTQQRNSNGQYATSEVHCDGFELQHKNDSGETVKLIGSRHMDLTHKTLELASPPQALSEMGVDLYDYEKREELRNAIDNLCAEVNAYLFEGKHAPEVIQADLFEDDEENAPVKKKKGKKSKDLVSELINTMDDLDLDITVSLNSM